MRGGAAAGVARLEGHPDSGVRLLAVRWPEVLAADPGAGAARRKRRGLALLWLPSTCPTLGRRGNLMVVTGFCLNCTYFEPLDQHDPEASGECRRYAPRPDNRPATAAYDDGSHEPHDAMWPEVLGNAWCGEWRLHARKRKVYRGRK